MENGTAEVRDCYVYAAQPYSYVVYAKIVNGWLTTFCVVLGTIGNIHGIKSVQMSNLEKNRGVVLAVSMMALALWDTTLLWCAFFYYGAKQMPLGLSADFLNTITPWFHAFSQIANTASIWCVVAITTQRFLATRDPFRSSRSAVVMQSFRSERRISFIYCASYRRLFRMPMLLSLGAVVINITSFFEIIAVPCFRKATNELSVQLLATTLRQNSHYRFYRLISRMVLVSIGPNIYIFCMTLIMLYFLRRSNGSRRQLFQLADTVLERHASRETTQTWISMLIVAKFLFFRSLTFFLDIMEVTTGVENFFLVDISNFLVIVNSATNCFVFLKASQWLSNRWVERKTMKRKKTVCDLRQMLGDHRMGLLKSSWENALTVTNGQLGLRVLYSILRKHPQLFNSFRQPQQQVHQPHTQESELVALLTNGNRRSFDIITNTKYQEVADRITSFISELIDMLSTGLPEHYIVLRIRRVGAVHANRGLQFTSSVFKEFKASTIQIVTESEFPNPTDREAVMDTWNVFISFIIREMKMGTWAMDENQLL